MTSVWISVTMLSPCAEVKLSRPRWSPCPSDWQCIRIRASERHGGRPGRADEAATGPGRPQAPVSGARPGSRPCSSRTPKTARSPRLRDLRCVSMDSCTGRQGRGDRCADSHTALWSWRSRPCGAHGAAGCGCGGGGVQSVQSVLFAGQKLFQGVRNSVRSVFLQVSACSPFCAPSETVSDQAIGHFGHFGHFGHIRHFGQGGVPHRGLSGPVTTEPPPSGEGSDEL